MFRLVNITFFANGEYTDTDEMLRKQHTSYIYIDHCLAEADITVIKHYTNPAMRILDHAHFRFFPAKNRFGYLSKDTIAYLKQTKPDILMVEGCIFPWQVIRARWILGRKTKIVVRHHAELPFRGMKRFLQQWADRYIRAYFFTSTGNAAPWVRAGIIGDAKKIVEMPATLTSFTRRNKTIARLATNMDDRLNYLWVGRLNANKDPLTVLTAFKELGEKEDVMLHMIYQTEELLPQVKTMIEEDAILQKKVTLVGYMPYEQLSNWYSAADFLISASYSEGGCAAVLEAMACGCIPIVTNIPASMKVIDEGGYGLYFEPGDAEGLHDQLVRSTHIPFAQLSHEVEQYFITHYSATAIASRMMQVFQNILPE